MLPTTRRLALPAFRRTPLLGALASALLLMAGAGLMLLVLELTPLTVRLLAPSLAGDTTTPMHRVYPGVPFVQVDGGVATVCVSNKDTWTLPPFAEARGGP